MRIIKRQYIFPLFFFFCAFSFFTLSVRAMEDPLLYDGILQDSLPLQPVGLKQMPWVTLKSGNLRMVFVDNSEMPPNHKKGYNGIAELYHVKQDSNVFVPDFAGLNLEHIFNGEKPEAFFEPRKDPMYLYQKSEKEVLLYQKPTTHSKVESLMEFKAADQDCIDFTFTFIVHDRHYFKHDYAGFFFASYINQPPDRKIYFKGIRERGPGSEKIGLIQSYSDKHGDKSTHLAEGDNRKIYFSPEFNIVLANHFSDYRYAQPYYYGRFRNMALAYFFRPSDLMRFSQSPDGAGPGNPAWDFYYITTDLKEGVKYSFSGRMMYKPFKSDKEIAREYKKWQRKQ